MRGVWRLLPAPRRSPVALRAAVAVVSLVFRPSPGPSFRPFLFPVRLPAVRPSPSFLGVRGEGGPRGTAFTPLVKGIKAFSHGLKWGDHRSKGLTSGSGTRGLVTRPESDNLF
jgi:hypothetical protein